MNIEWNESRIIQTLDWAYEKAVNGFPGVDSAIELADEYRKKGGTPVEQANSLIRWQATKAATAGFVTGLGGVLTMPVTLPANLASVLYVQIRMVAAIAHLGGVDVRDRKVKSLVFACMVANSATDVAKDVGIAIGNRLALSALKKVSASTLMKINKRVGFRLLTNLGDKGMLNLAKGVPFAGGVVGGTIDAMSTKTIGHIARDTFLSSSTPEAGEGIARKAIEGLKSIVSNRTRASRKAPAKARKAPARTARKAASKAPAKSATKAARKAPAKKSAVKKSAVKKSAAKKSVAKKVAQTTT